LQKQRAN